MVEGKTEQTEGERKDELGPEHPKPLTNVLVSINWQPSSLGMATNVSLFYHWNEDSIRDG